MKKLILALLLSPSLFAATIATNVTGNAIDILRNQPLLINKITVSSTPGLTITFTDSPSTNLTFAQAQYTNVVITVGLTTNTYVNINGRTNTTVYPSITSTPTTVPASSVPYKTIIQMIVPANGTSIFQPTSPVIANQGLNALHTAAASITVDYNDLQ